MHFTHVVSQEAATASHTGVGGGEVEDVACKYKSHCRNYHNHPLWLALLLPHNGGATASAARNWSPIEIRGAQSQWRRGVSVSLPLSPGLGSVLRAEEWRALWRLQRGLRWEGVPPAEGSAMSKCRRRDAIINRQNLAVGRRRATLTVVCVWVSSCVGGVCPGVGL